MVARIILAFLLSLLIFIPILKGKSGYFVHDLTFHSQNDYP
jgi:hypothetical protein